MLSVIAEAPSVRIGDFTLQLELDEPSVRSEEIARAELRETAEVKQQALAELKQLLDAETDLHWPKDNEKWLICFLRPCKFYPESARDLIKRCYNFKKNHASLCQGLVPSKEANVFKHNILTLNAVRDQLGRRVALLTLGKAWNVDQLKANELIKGLMLCTEAISWEPTTQIHGCVAVFDLEGFGLKQSFQLTPTIIKTLLDFMQDSLPLRLKAAHIVFETKLFDVVFKIFKQFLNKKLAKRIYFHGSDMKSLHQHIAPECLPARYGGTATDVRVDSRAWYELFLQYEHEFETINSYGYKKK